VLAVLLAMSISQSIIYKNFLYPVVATAIAIIILSILKKRVDGVVADERDYNVAGNSARYAMTIFSFVAVFAMFFFLAFEETNPFYEAIAMTLAYSVCFLMILYSLIFRFYNKISFSNKKKLYVVLLSAIILILIIGGLRFLSGEDGWICDNGNWVTHGHPSFPAPNESCK
jgi:uncharacterized membrane protein